MCDPSQLDSMGAAEWGVRSGWGKRGPPLGWLTNAWEVFGCAMLWAVAERASAQDGFRGATVWRSIYANTMQRHCLPSAKLITRRRLYLLLKHVGRLHLPMLTLISR